MKYLSTRGHSAGQNFTDILLEGLAPDGGLAVPEQWPRITRPKLDALRDLAYPQLAFEVLRFFADDFPGAELKAIAARAYTKEVFGTPEITPLKTLEDNLHLLACSNGPTLAFKDIAMQLIGHLFEHVSPSFCHFYPPKTDIFGQMDIESEEILCIGAAMNTLRSTYLGKARRVVLKVGSAVLTAAYGLNLVLIQRLVAEIAGLRQNDRQFVLVSSGAVAAGVHKLKLAEKPQGIPQQQAVAAAGQSTLMLAYEEAFAEHGVKVAQILLTHDDLGARGSFLNARNTLVTLLQWNVVPIINDFGNTPVKLAVEVNYYVERPDAFGPRWMIGLNITPVVPNFVESWFKGR